MSDEHLGDADTFYDAAEDLVDYWLRRAARLAMLLGSPSSSGLERVWGSAGSRDRTVPTDALCQLADVARMVRALSLADSPYFVHPDAARILVAARVSGDLYSAIADRHQIARRSVSQLVRTSTAQLAVQLWCANMDGAYRQENVA